MPDKKHVILYIDDDRDCIDVMRVILEKNGYQMLSASDAAEGLKVYKQSSPDLVIVDLMMEEVDAGTQFAKELQALGNTAPVYMLSSVGNNLGITVDTTQLGLAGVLQKPVDEKTLLLLLKAKIQ